MIIFKDLRPREVVTCLYIRTEILAFSIIIVQHQSKYLQASLRDFLEIVLHLPGCQTVSVSSAQNTIHCISS